MLSCCLNKYNLISPIQFIDLFQHFNNVDEITQNAATTLLFATTAFRMINFYRNRMRYVSIVKTVDAGLRELMTLSDETTKQIIANSIEYKRCLSSIFWFIALTTGNLMCLHSALQAVRGIEKSLILKSWFPFDGQRDHFWFCYSVQYFVMNIGMLIVPCWHSFIVSIMIFVIMKLKVLNHKLSGLKEDDDKVLMACINERKKLFNFVQELVSLISSSIFLDFIVFSVLLCALLFQATRVSLAIKLFMGS